MLRIHRFHRFLRFLEASKSGGIEGIENVESKKNLGTTSNIIYLMHGVGVKLPSRDDIKKIGGAANAHRSNY